MGSNTEELDLYKADPIADGNDTFNIDRMLNENWEKVDDGVKAVRFTVETKVDKEKGKGLSTNDYTTVEKDKLAGLSEGANKTIVEDTLTSASTVNALSAAQGKVLNDGKVEKVVGKGLSSNDYTIAEKTKLAALTIYNSFAQVNAGYTQTTALRTVMTAMALNSELHANVTASTADYPAAGTLHITKTVVNTASMVFDSATDKYYANVTPTNIEQIFGGGGKNLEIIN